METAKPTNRTKLGNPLTLNGQIVNELTAFQDQEEKLAQEMEAIEARKQLLIEQKKQAQENALNKLMLERDALRDDAQGFRAQARLATAEDEKKILYSFAADSERQARDIDGQLGVATPVEPEPRKSWIERNFKRLLLLQIGGILVMMGIAYNAFTELHNTIQDVNKELAFDKQMQPYDLTSVQKLAYEKFVQITDLPIALLLLLFVVPMVAFYVLPFVHSGKDFYREFYDELTPWQRSKLATCFILGFLLLAALSHLVKP